MTEYLQVIFLPTQLLLSYMEQWRIFGVTVNAIIASMIVITLIMKLWTEASKIDRYQKNDNNKNKEKNKKGGNHE